MRHSRAAVQLKDEFDRLGIWYRHNYVTDELPRNPIRLDFVLKARGRWIAIVITDQWPLPQLAGALRKKGYRVWILADVEVQARAREVAKHLVHKIKPDTRAKRNAEARRLIRAALGKRFTKKGAA
jgi:hypothetical protein